jgi:hypothetical protein
MLHLALVIGVGLGGAPLAAESLAAPAVPLLHPSSASTTPSPPTFAPTTLLARERGGRGHGGGSGRHHGRGDRSGFGGRHASLDRGNRRPDGGWSQRIGDGDRARRQFDRARRDIDRRDISRRDLERRGRRWLDDGLADVDRDRVRRSFDRAEHRWDRARREVRNLDDLHLDRRVDRALDRGVDRALDRARHWDDHWPGWVRPGWSLARPWRTGWYGDWNRPPWSWWGGRSLAWGVTSLATAAAINAAVDDAIAASRPTIPVADAGYSLFVNSVAPSGEEEVRFTAATGDTRFEAQADCRQGELNGREPASAAQAELVNAACQVAYGR